MDPARAQMNRLHNNRKRSYRKQVETFSHQEKSTVEQWVDFMQTAGYKQDGDVHRNQFDETLWCVKVIKITRT